MYDHKSPQAQSSLSKEHVVPPAVEVVKQGPPSPKQLLKPPMHMHIQGNNNKKESMQSNVQSPKPTFKSAMNIEWVSGSRFRFLDDDVDVEKRDSQRDLSVPHTVVHTSEGEHMTPVVAWNIRGAVNKNGRRYAKEMVLKHQPEIVIIMETHCQFASASSLWNSLGFSSIGIVEARGHSGGIWVLSRIVAETLPSVPIPLSPLCHDQVVWNGKSDGIYTVSSAYNWLGTSLRDWCRQHDSVGWVWKLKVPSKVQFFALLVTLSALHTNALRLRCGLSLSSACGRCS
ncbi:hypothetical protein RIF29_38170 [Crotalaria pallida]|uniref:Reverse transcriptase zinc-binding domain-containing protein n=1 Tax=Crotalaria pallida TaxID=3830 RepID=A0AAN9HNP0_CROPI